MIGFGPWLTMMICAIVILFTIQILLRDLYRRQTLDVPRRWSWVLTAGRWLVVVFMALITAGMLGFSFGYAVVAMAFALMIQSILMRRAEETELLNWLAFSVVSGGGSIPDAFEQFAGKRVNLLSRRCRDFAYELRTGMRPSMAAKKRRLPLSVDALLALDDGQRSPARLATDNLQPNARLGLSVGWSLANQFAYLVITIVLILTIFFICLFIVPTLVVMFEEFGMSPNFALVFLDRFDTEIMAVGWLLLALASVFCGLIAVCFLWPSKWLLRVTPWYGGWVRHRGQYHGLLALAAGLRSGRSMAESTKQAELLTHSRWIKSRANAACRRLDSGQSIASALCKSGFVTEAESRWIAAADVTGHLANSLESIAESSRRRFELLWRIRLSWLIPLTVLLFGSCVVFLFSAVVGSLNDIIYSLS